MPEILAKVDAAFAFFHAQLTSERMEWEQAEQEFASSDGAG